MNKDYAQQILNKVYRDYNKMSVWFSKTRGFVWGELEEIKELIDQNNRVLDLGCGNGRLVGLLEEKQIDYLGVDVSDKLIDLARKKYPQKKFLVADALNLPFENKSFDKVVCIAVLHHVPSKELRVDFLKEVRRVLKSDGALILSVWNLWRSKFFKYHLKYFFKKISFQTKLDFKDIFYPFKNQKGEILAQRYLHAFTKKELKRLAQKSGFRVEKIEFLGKNKRNIYLVARPL